MADAASATGKSVGSNLDLIKVLFSRPEWGFLFLLVLVAESALLAISLVTSDRNLSYGSLAAFVVVLLGAMGLFLALIRRTLPIPAVATNLAAPAISTEEAERRPDLLYTSRDGTFAVGKVPPGWTVSHSSFESFVTAAAAGQGLQFAGQAGLPFRPGELMMIKASREMDLAYIPGRTRLNGRPAVSQFPERYASQVIIFSVSRFGTLLREVPAEHLFATFLGMMASGPAPVVEVGNSVLNGHKTLTARLRLEVDDAEVNGTSVAKLIFENQLHVVERPGFTYVATAQFVVDDQNDSLEREVRAILNSIQPTEPPDAEARLKADAAETEAAFSTIVPGVLALKAQTLVDQMQHEDGSVRATEQQAGHMKLLADYADSLSTAVPEDLRSLIHGAAEAAAEAAQGDPAPLRTFIAELKQ